MRTMQLDKKTLDGELVEHHVEPPTFCAKADKPFPEMKLLNMQHSFDSRAETGCRCMVQVQIEIDGVNQHFCFSDTEIFGAIFGAIAKAFPTFTADCTYLNLRQGNSTIVKPVRQEGRQMTATVYVEYASGNCLPSRSSQTVTDSDGLMAFARSCFQQLYQRAVVLHQKD